MRTGTAPTTTFPYRLTRVGVLMEPEPGLQSEAEGVLNPATAWTPDGDLLLFPRQVAAGNVSQVGTARVVIRDGVPVDVERLGPALIANRGWEHGVGHGGVEDPRITWIPSLGLHVMTYVAFGPLGPVPALAVSDDARSWRRLGPLRFAYDDHLATDLSLFPNKDVVLFPDIVPGPDGTPSYALLHRPMWELTFARPGEEPPIPETTIDPRPSIWISYMPAEDVHRDLRQLTFARDHRLVASPEHAWESVKIGAGTPPRRTEDGWLVLTHGVTGRIVGSAFEPQSDVHYAAGAILLDPADPARVLSRTAAPLLSPEAAHERDGVVPNVVFPTAIERIDGVDYVFYGMADARIGVARLDRIADGTT